MHVLAGGCGENHLHDASPMSTFTIVKGFIAELGNSYLNYLILLLTLVKRYICKSTGSADREEKSVSKYVSISYVK